MHFVTGGAYNGKANWVRSYYDLENEQANHYKWISAYNDESFPEDLASFSERIIVLEGLEKWLLPLVQNDDIDAVRNEFHTVLEKWRQWIKDNDSGLIIIGVDMSKGVVPIDATARKWRDITGFIYQDIVKTCSQFHYVWYGIGEQLK